MLNTGPDRFIQTFDSEVGGEASQKYILLFWQRELDEN